VRRAAQGVDLGPLQGIPYGLKDLIAVEGYRTTWGAPAYLAQVLPDSASVYGRCAARRILTTQSKPLFTVSCFGGSYGCGVCAARAAATLGAHDHALDRDGCH